MKKIILFAGLLVCGLAQAQITVMGNGTPITDGYVFTTNSLNFDGDAKLTIVSTNVSDQPINIKLRIDSMENADGNSFNVQFCVEPTCYFTVQEGSIVPPEPSGTTLAPGESSNSNDHFANAYEGDVPGLPVIYNISVIEVTDDGTVVGPLVSFTYRYEPTAGVSDFASLQNIGISLGSTLVKNQMEITAQQPATMEVFGINGQLVKKAAIAAGQQSVDVSGLHSAVYIVRFTNDKKRSSQIRIVKN